MVGESSAAEIKRLALRGAAGRDAPSVAIQVRGSFSSACEPVWPSGKTLSPFLIGRMFVREPSWEYSANLVGS